MKRRRLPWTRSTIRVSIAAAGSERGRAGEGRRRWPKRLRRQQGRGRLNRRFESGRLLVGLMMGVMRFELGIRFERVRRVGVLLEPWRLNGVPLWRRERRRVMSWQAPRIGSAGPGVSGRARAM